MVLDIKPIVNEHISDILRGFLSSSNYDNFIIVFKCFLGILAVNFSECIEVIIDDHIMFMVTRVLQLVSSVIV
jgi:hypothetical protein